MKEKIILIIIALSTLSSCSILMYSLLFKVIETPYFRTDFKRNVQDKKSSFIISDSTQISSKAIQLIREKEGVVYSYWIDLEVYNEGDKAYAVKIVNQEGKIERFFAGWLDLPDDVILDFKSYRIEESKNGKVKFCFGDFCYPFIHYSDAMGLHHTKIVRPSNISKNASLSMIFGGYSYQYHWIVFDKIMSGFFVLSKYDYKGKFQEKVYLELPKDFKINLGDNYYFDNNYHYYNLHLNNSTYKLTINDNALNGYGEDVSLDFLSPIFQGFSVDSYISNVLNNLREMDINFYRNADNLLMLNETVKAVGYKNFISKEEFFKPRLRVYKGVDLNGEISLAEFVDSLIIYSKGGAHRVFYNEFWLRREKEGTDKIVLSILEDVKNEYSGKLVITETAKINTTLMQLFSYDTEFRNTKNIIEKEQLVLDYFSFLIENKLHQSAFNLIYNTEETIGLNLDSNTTYLHLEIDDIPEMTGRNTLFLTKNKPIWNISDYFIYDY